MPDPQQLAHESAWDDLPYGAVPTHTRRGVQHKVVEVVGNLFAGWHRVGQTVVGRTACGKRGLQMDRDACGPFPLCRRCYPDTPTPTTRVAPVRAQLAARRDEEQADD